MNDSGIDETELHAYVDGQLDAKRRIEVGTYLEQHPGVAAAVLRDMRLRDELRLFLDGEGEAAPPRTELLVRQLARVFLLASFASPLRVAVSAAALIALGWFGHAQLGNPGTEAEERPAEVLADDAAQAYRVVRLKVVAAGVPRSVGPPPASDAAGDGGSALLPKGFRRVAAEDLPWDGGTAELELLVGPHGNTLVLLAARTDEAAMERPEAESVDGVTTVSWQSGRTAYALSGDGSASDLLSIARTLGPAT